MRKYLLLFALYSISHHLIAQKVNVDSLWTIWRSEAQADTQRPKALDDLIFKHYQKSKPDSALYYSNVYYEFAKKKKLDKYMARGYNCIGTSWLRMGKYDEATTYLKQSLELCEQGGFIDIQAASLNNLGKTCKQVGDFERAIEYYNQSAQLFKQLSKTEDKQKATDHKKGLANALNNTGSVYMDLGNYDKAIEYYTQSLNIREEIGAKAEVASSLNNIGIIYFYQGNLAMSIDFWLKSVRIKEETGDQRGMAITLHNIGNIYTEQGEFDKALEYYNRSLAIRETINDKEGIAYSHNVIGSVYGSKKEPDKAIEHYLLSLALAEELGAKPDIGGSHSNIGSAYADKGDYEKALAHYHKSLEILEPLGDKMQLAQAHNGIGGVYYRTKMLDKALAHGNKGLLLSQETGAVNDIKTAAHSLYDIYRAKGNHQKALEMHELFITMRDSIASEKNQKEVLRQKFQYEYEKKEELLKAEQEKRDVIAKKELERKELQRNALLGGFGLTLLLAGVFLIQRNRISKEKKRSDELLLNILPEETAQELKQKGYAEAKLYDEVTVLFTDFKDFTEISEKLAPAELVAEVNECFKAFDQIMEKYSIEKIKTIGDAYMAAGGLPVPNQTNATDVVNAALEMRDFMLERKKVLPSGEALGGTFEIRIGIHTGPVVAGIVGIKKFQYDIWGDTVNTASRMESSGEVGRVNISEFTYELVKDQFTCQYRGEIEAKGKGKVKMYFIESAL